MEDRQLPITVGQGAGARVVTLDLPPFTLVGATTRAGPADDAAARPLRHPAPARALRPRRPGADRHALGARCSAIEIDAGGRARDRRAQPRHAARRQPPAQARARLRRGARPTASIDGRRPPTPRSTCSRSTTRASTGSTASCCARSASCSAAARSGSRRSPSRSARSRTRSRTSTSPTCSSAASSSARRAGACATARALAPPRARAAAASDARRCSDATSLRDRERFTARCAVYAYAVSSDGAPLHLPELRQPHDRDRPHRRLPPRAEGLREVRLRLPLRAARRLLPGAQRRLLRLRPRGPRDRLRARLLRADRPRRGRSSAARCARCSGSTSTSGEDLVGTVLEWGVRALGKPVRSTPRATCPRRRSPTCFPPTTTTAACCSC